MDTITLYKTGLQFKCKCGKIADVVRKGVKYCIICDPKRLALIETIKKQFETLQKGKKK